MVEQTAVQIDRFGRTPQKLYLLHLQVLIGTLAQDGMRIVLEHLDRGTML